MVYYITDKEGKTVAAFSEDNEVFHFLAATKKSRWNKVDTLGLYNVQVFAGERRVTYITGFSFVKTYEASETNIPF